MKRTLSIILSLVMAISILIVPASVSAKQTKKTPNTYVATDEEYLNFSKGTIHKGFWGGLYYYKNSGKKSITIDTFNRTAEEGIFNYYVRGNKVYYCMSNAIEPYNYDKQDNFILRIKTFDLNSKKRTVLYKKSEEKDKNLLSIGLIGGYGSGVIFYEFRSIPKSDKYEFYIKMLRNNKTTTLFKFKTKKYVNFYIFNGKIYYNNKAYNIANGKKTTFTAKKTYVTNNYMYYINKNNNLKCIDKKDVRRIVTKNVFKYYYGNNGASVIYSKVDKNNIEVFYKRTINQKEYRLCTWRDILKAYNSVDTKSKHSSNLAALFYNNKVYFRVDARVFNVNLTGGTPKLLMEKTEYDSIRMYLFGKKLVFEPFNYFDYEFEI